MTCTFATTLLLDGKLNGCNMRPIQILKLLKLGTVSVVDNGVSNSRLGAQQSAKGANGFYVKKNVL